MKGVEEVVCCMKLCNIMLLRDVVFKWWYETGFFFDIRGLR